MKPSHLILACLCVALSHAAAETKPPADQFDLSHWKLTLPVDAAGDSSIKQKKATTVEKQKARDEERARKRAKQSNSSTRFQECIRAASLSP